MNRTHSETLILSQQEAAIGALILGRLLTKFREEDLEIQHVINDCTGNMAYNMVLCALELDYEQMRKIAGMNNDD